MYTKVLCFFCNHSGIWLILISIFTCISILITSWPNLRVTLISSKAVKSNMVWLLGEKCNVTISVVLVLNCLLWEWIHVTSEFISLLFESSFKLDSSISRWRSQIPPSTTICTTYWTSLLQYNTLSSLLHYILIFIH